MNILFTGGSSFTGYWFVRELVAAGHSVCATMRGRGVEEYEGVRRERVEGLLERCDLRWGISFGEPGFFSLLKEKSWDLLCHHAADVTDYRSPLFDPIQALATNTKGYPSLFESGLERVILTGSVFEGGEGWGAERERDFSPYGLSKRFSFELMDHYAQEKGVKVGKFVIPNPFGAYEEVRFTAYLMNRWLRGEGASVKTPLYIRDNIPVSLLALSYVKFVERFFGGEAISKCSPSGYVESQGAFAQRVAREVEKRLSLPCSLELASQQSFSEPFMCVNGERVNGEALGWREERSWDDFVAFYEQRHLAGLALC